MCVCIECSSESNFMNCYKKKKKKKKKNCHGMHQLPFDTDECVHSKMQVCLYS